MRDRVAMVAMVAMTVFPVAGCDERARPAQPGVVVARAPAAGERYPLVAARAAIKATQILGEADPQPAPRPPAGVFEATSYASPAGRLVAYESPRGTGPRRPAIIWIAGGFSWGIDAGAWEPGEPFNDQSASQLRVPGIVVMRPALRGASGNPGKPELFLGEVDDILAARAHLAQRPDVDPARIYLGGHSTGGTLALLAAASTDQFRAVFALGPASDPRQYGDALPAGAPEAEYLARAPIGWIGTITSPTFVIEGRAGNAAVLAELGPLAAPVVKFLEIDNADHFSVIAPTLTAIARAILADRGPRAAIALDPAAIRAAVVPAP